LPLGAIYKNEELENVSISVWSDWNHALKVLLDLRLGPFEWVTGNETSASSHDPHLLYS
jgi:hypothetical protein